MDIEDDPLTVEETIGLVGEGILQLVIVDGDNAVDTQLDAMVASWENRHLSGLTLSHDSTTVNNSVDSSNIWEMPKVEHSQDDVRNFRKIVDLERANISVDNDLKAGKDDTPRNFGSGLSLSENVSSDAKSPKAAIESISRFEVNEVNSVILQSISLFNVCLI